MLASKDLYTLDTLPSHRWNIFALLTIAPIIIFANGIISTKIISMVFWPNIQSSRFSHNLLGNVCRTPSAFRMHNRKHSINYISELNNLTLCCSAASSRWQNNKIACQTIASLNNGAHFKALSILFTATNCTNDSNATLVVCLMPWNTN